jgi:hypothetical protein
MNDCMRNACFVAEGGNDCMRKLVFRGRGFAEEITVQSIRRTPVIFKLGLARLLGHRSISSLWLSAS